jgi:hypothetical protein
MIKMSSQLKLKSHSIINLIDVSKNFMTVSRYLDKKVFDSYVK